MSRHDATSALTMMIALFTIVLFSSSSAQQDRQPSIDRMPRNDCKCCTECGRYERWKVLSAVQQEEGVDTYWIYDLLQVDSGKVKSGVVINRRVSEVNQIVKTVA